MKLLLVDDQEHVLRLERMVLITDGFDVETASGGREALEKLKSTRYDGLVLDMLMPELDGCEVVRQLKSVGLNRQTPVIMVTAGLEPGMRQRAFEAGATAFLNKPFTAEAFRSVIHSAISPPQQPSVSSTRAAPTAPAPPVPAPLARPAVGQIGRAETGATFSAHPTPGGWRCGRCESG
jgi:CheY-like chemotaxis protein